MNPRIRLRAALQAWPWFAVAWSLHGVLLIILLRPYLSSGNLVWGVQLQAYSAIACLLVIEVAAVSLASALFELLTSKVPRKRVLDLAQGFAIALIVGLLVASSLKFKQTSVHLKSTDLWFASSNLLQLLQEGQSVEIMALLGLPLGILALGVFGYLALRRLRKSSFRIQLRLPLLLVCLSFVGLVATTKYSPGVGLFLSEFTPEGFWLTSRMRPFQHLGSDLDPAQESAEILGPPIKKYVAKASQDRPNIVLIMLESVPWKRTPFGGDPIPSLPNLSQLAEESLLFSRAYAVSTHSDYAQMAILSSLHPRKYEHHDFYSKIEYPRTLLWDALKAAGYSTEMFSCQNERWGNMLNFLNTPGLDLLRHAPSWPNEEHKGRGIESKVHDETAVSQWIRWRRRGGRRPFFSYLNLQANHFPYEIPSSAERSHQPSELTLPVTFFGYPKSQVDTLTNRFYNALEYTDLQIGRVVRALKEQGIWNQTAMIVVSDHGEAFYEHEQPTHGSALFEEQIRSVLLMKLPGEAPRIVEAPVSHLDIAPAILEYLGLPRHGNFQGNGAILDREYSALGRPMFFTIQGITREDGVLLNDWKYFVNWDKRSRSLYDLSADPDELLDLSPVNSEQIAAMDGVLRTFLESQLTYYRDKSWIHGRYPRQLP